MCQLVDHIVVVNDPLGRGEVGVEQRLRAGRDRLGRQGRQPDYVGAHLREMFVEAPARFSCRCHPVLQGAGSIACATIMPVRTGRGP